MGIFRIPQRYRWVQTDVKSTEPFTLEIDMETVNQELDSTLASIEESEFAALELARRSGFTGPSLDRIGLAVREITTNAGVQGNRSATRKKVFVLVSPKTFSVGDCDLGSGSGF
jgi:hypothetical protein